MIIYLLLANSNMKKFLCFSILFLFYYMKLSSEQRFAKHNLEPQDFECLKQLNYTADFVVGSFDAYNFLQENNTHLNEFVACSWKKSGYLNENNTLDTNKIKAWLERDLIRTFHQKNMTANDIMEPCRNITGVGVGDVAIKIYNCMNRRLLGF